MFSYLYYIWYIGGFGRKEPDSDRRLLIRTDVSRLLGLFLGCSCAILISFFAKTTFSKNGFLPLILFFIAFLAFYSFLFLVYYTPSRIDKIITKYNNRISILKARILTTVFLFFTLFTILTEIFILAYMMMR